MTANAGQYGAGIGGGGGGGCASYITITGGEVIATGGGGQGAGIGGRSDYYGYFGDASHITITGGQVTAVARGRGAGIGGGNGSGSDIYITGGIVIAQGANASDIGGNKPSNESLIQTVEVFDMSGNLATNNISNSFVYSNKKYEVKGNVVFNRSLLINSDESLIINENASLTITKDLVNNGDIHNDGSVFVQEYIYNNGQMTGHKLPSIEGIEDNANYCQLKNIIVKGDDLEKVTLKIGDEEAKEITLNNDGSYTLLTASTNDVIQETIAFDSQGNKVVKKVIINNHQISEWIVDEEATFNSTGKMHKECEICHSIIETKTIPQFLQYSFIEGNDMTYILNSKQSCVLKIDADYNKFQYIEVDGYILNQQNYSVKQWSTIVTFNKDYMNTLQVGTHQVKIYFSDGLAMTQIYVKEKAVNTGDNNLFELWLSIMLIASLGLMILKKQSAE